MIKTFQIHNAIFPEGSSNALTAQKKFNSQVDAAKSLIAIIDGGGEVVLRTY